MVAVCGRALVTGVTASSHPPFKYPPPTMAADQREPPQPSASGIFSNVFGFVAREVQSFVIAASGGEVQVASIDLLR